MKKIIFLLAITLGMFSCEEDGALDNEVDNYSGPDVTYFTDGTSGSYFVTPAEEAATIQIGSTTTSASDRTFTVVVDAASTATSGVDYSLATTSVTIPANEYFAEINVQGIFAGVTPEGTNLLLSLEGNGPIEATYDLSIIQLCESDLAGMYSVTTTYGYHDFLPTFSTNTQDVEIMEVDDATYFIQDFSGGLYDGGPYSAPYGTGPESFDVTFTENCGTIAWENQSDPWGTVVQQPGTSSTVDFDSGVITISWFCNGYGENGVSVYTPL